MSRTKLQTIAPSEADLDYGFFANSSEEVNDWMRHINRDQAGWAEFVTQNGCRRVFDTNNDGYIWHQELLDVLAQYAL